MIENILNERGTRYGNFEDNAIITQSLKAVMNTSPNSEYLTSDQREALEMIFHKIGRILNGDPNYVDSWVDIAGYATLVADRLETPEEEEEESDDFYHGNVHIVQLALPSELFYQLFSQ